MRRGRVVDRGLQEEALPFDVMQNEKKKREIRGPRSASKV